MTSKQHHVTGSCNCGQVKISVSEPITDVYVCHCSICRKSTGGNGIYVVVVDKKSITWLSGEDQIQEWEKPNHDWQKTFCKTCGSPLPGSNDEHSAYIPAGFLDTGIENLEVKHHIWVGSKATWDIIGDDGKIHDQAFGG